MDFSLSGSANPSYPALILNKYSKIHLPKHDYFIPANIEQNTAELLRASLSLASWSKNATAMKCFEKFDSQSPNIHNWPLSEKSICEFVTWAVVVCKLKAATIKSYLAAISLAHKFKGWNSSACNGFLVKSLLKGAENLEFYLDISRESRKALSLPILKILGHQLAVSDMTENDKLVLWTAAVVAFFGSFRLGEILAKNERNFNQSDILLWSDVKIKDDSILLHIKIPKNRIAKGEFVDIFEFDKHNCCPVKALKKLYLSKGRNLNKNSPVFCFENGKLLTPSLLTSTMRSLLHPRIGAAAEQLSGHSFRAALPSALANNDVLASDEEIKLWGRWGSPSYKRYIKLEMKRRRAIFVKIVSSLSY